MRKLYIVIVICMGLIVSGCGVDEEVFNKTKQEKQALEKQLNKIKQEKEALEKQFNEVKNKEKKLENKVEELENEIEELENGAERRLREIKATFDKENYEKVANLVGTLEEKHPGSPETKEAISIREKAQDKLDEIEQRKKKEEERKRKEAMKSKRDKAREIIRVSKVYPSTPNSAGGVDLHIVWQNRSDKTVKYITFSVEPYNGVGDVVSCDIRDSSRFNGKVTGPIKPSQWHGKGYLWECAWYNNTIRSVELLEVDIEYIDGSRVRLKGEQIDYIRY